MISNNSESITLGQLGSNSLHFLGTNPGVLPIGPNGIHGLDTLQPSPLSDAGTNAAILSYNYTLNHQGLTSNISCIYDTQSPITYSVEPSSYKSGTVYGSCKGLADLRIGENYHMPYADAGTLAFWACPSISTEQKDPAYYIYLRGCGGSYESEIGNISCSVSLTQPAVFPVTYQSSTHLFSAQEQIKASETHYTLTNNPIENAIVSLWDVLTLAQNLENNLVAESVMDLGVQAFGLLPSGQNAQYLLLYEAMIQGILEDQVCTANNSSLPLLMVVLQVTYERFLYLVNSDTPPPASCNRTVNGTFSAEVTGWVTKPVHIGFLMPMTILNLASLIVASISITKAKRSRHEFDPTDPRSLVLAESSLDESEPSGWADGVSYRPREVRECQISFQY